MAEPFEAWLYKAAGKRWKRRWFVLDGPHLSLYSSEAKKMSLGSSTVSGLTLDVVANPLYFTMQLSGGSKPVLYGCDTQPEMDAWISHFGEHGVTLGDTATDPAKRPPPPDAAAPAAAASPSGAGAGAAAGPPRPPPPPPLPPRKSAGAGAGAGGAGGAAAGAATAASPSAPSSAEDAAFQALVEKYRTPSPDNLSKLFDMVDSSGDGSISVSEWCSSIRKFKSGKSKLRTNLGTQLSLFNLIDTDGSGDVDRDEFVAGLSGTDNTELLEWMALCLATAEAGEAKAATEAAPATPATTTSALPAAITGLSESEIEARRAQMCQLYDVIDVNGDGDVTVSELLTSFRKFSDGGALGSSLDSQLRLFASMDADGSGGLDRDEFVSASLQITDETFSEWVDRVLYEDQLASQSAALATADAQAEASVQQEKKRDRKSIMVADSNPFFKSTGSPTTDSPSSATSTPKARGMDRSTRASIALGRVARKNPLAGRRRRGGKK